MTKEEYIKSNIIKLMHHWISMSLGFGSLLIIAFCLLDYLVTPSNFKTFLFYRTIAAIGAFLLYLFNRRKIDVIRLYLIPIIGAIIVCTMIALMISKFGGHQSPYFAGMILAIFVIVGLTSLDIAVTITTSFVIYAIYLLPILLYDTPITNKAFFINANFFILSTIAATVILRYLIQRRFIREFGLQYDLDQQKEKLEEIVQERTKELIISEKKLKSLFEYATDGIMILDKEGKILDVNQKACEIYGFDRNEIINTDIVFYAEDKSLSGERLERILKGESLLFETQHFRRDGKRVSLEITANAIEVEGNVLIQAFVRDITDKKRLQEQLLQSQKMESIGSLAGGIAHNFNNLLTAILGNAELLEDYDYSDDKHKKRVKNIEHSAKKAGALVSKLLSFARKESFEIVPLYMNDLIKETLLFEGVLGKKIQIRTNLKETIPTVEGDRNQLEQVIMNLIVNARDAMLDGGVITITSSMTKVQKDNLDIPTYIRPGHYVMVTVSDTGCGIPDHTINRVFEPFFTTKERGKGTGLGLATVYGIVKDHTGYVTVQSEMNKGTTFHVYLPVSGKPVPDTIKSETVDLYGQENVLVVDDEEDVLDYIKDSLETHGYQAIATNNPIEALDLFKELADEVDLVITDIIMPQMEGQEIIMHLRTIRHDIKIIAISGYSDGPIRKEDFLIDAFIKKPFEGAHLLSTVRHILDKKTAFDTKDATRMAT